MNKSFNEKTSEAFTRVELIAILAVVVMLAFLTLPALAHSKSKSAGSGCISTLRQMMIGWEMYKEDNGDKFVPNTQFGGSSGWIGSSANEGWSAMSGNTNVAYLASGLMAPYIGNDFSIYKCPADVVPSANGQRLRSRSMNGQIGYSGINFNSGWPVYIKGSDLTCPTPANAWIFCDESPYSLNDGYLQTDLNTPDYPDVPANYHDQACGFSFADGHAEEHRWLGRMLSVPVAYGVVNNGAHWASSVQDVDYFWLRQHSACKN